MGNIDFIIVVGRLLGPQPHQDPYQKRVQTTLEFTENLKTPKRFEGFWGSKNPKFCFFVMASFWMLILRRSAKY